MVYPWSKKSNDEKEESVTEIKEEIVEKTEDNTNQDLPESGEAIVEEEKRGEEIVRLHTPYHWRSGNFPRPGSAASKAGP